MRPKLTRGNIKLGLLVCGLAVCTMISGCKSKPPAATAVKPLAIQIAVVAAADLNPDRNGQASPVYLRVYQLRDDGKFAVGSFEDVTARADATLGNAIVNREQRTIHAGTTTLLNLTITPDTRLVGVVAEYADPESTWRAASPQPTDGLLTLLKKSTLTIKLERHAVSVVTAPREKGK